MTVADLAKSLEGLDPKMSVVVIHENDGQSDSLTSTTLPPELVRPAEMILVGRASRPVWTLCIQQLTMLEGRD